MREFSAEQNHDSSGPDPLAPQLAQDADFLRYTAPWRPSRHSARLRFGPELERDFEAATQPARVRELRLTISLSVIFYLLTTFTDQVLVPDIGHLGLWLRMCTLPIWAVFVIFAHRFSARLREGCAVFLATVAVLLLAAMVFFSRSGTAPYGFTTAMLALIYVNTTYPLRFGRACAGTLVSLAGALGVVFTHPTIGEGMAWTLTLMIYVSGSYSLISCYRIERSQRLAFLLSFRESQRLAALEADRDAVTELSKQDALTGLSNRRHFDDCIAVAFRRPWRSVALLMVDVDHFKRYNDSYGHPAGDATLRQVARIIGDAVRVRGDLAARYGGEEFVLLLENLTPDQAEVVAGRLCVAVADSAITHANRDDGLGVVTISIGAAVRTLEGAVGPHEQAEAAARLIDAADRALYEAKRRGRNRVEVTLEA